MNIKFAKEQKSSKIKIGYWNVRKNSKAFCNRVGWGGGRGFLKHSIEKKGEICWPNCWGAIYSELAGRILITFFWYRWCMWHSCSYNNHKKIPVIFVEKALGAEPNTQRPFQWTCAYLGLLISLLIWSARTIWANKMTKRTLTRLSAVSK